MNADPGNLLVPPGTVAIVHSSPVGMRVCQDQSLNFWKGFTKEWWHSHFLVDTCRTVSLLSVLLWNIFPACQPGYVVETSQ